MKSEASNNIIDSDEIDKPKVSPNSTLASELSTLFVGELNPVAPKAQKKVPIPEG